MHTQLVFYQFRLQIWINLIIGIVCCEYDTCNLVCKDHLLKFLRLNSVKNVISKISSLQDTKPFLGGYLIWHNGLFFSSQSFSYLNCFIFTARAFLQTFNSIIDSFKNMNASKTLIRYSKYQILACRIRINQKNLL